jgi:Animal haem peroxidase
MLKRPWHQLPIILGLLKLVQFRDPLRKHNLHDTSQLPDSGKLPSPNASVTDALQARTADGSYNDLEDYKMGMAGTRFGRNVPLEEATLDKAKLLTPNPLLISHKLLAREEFIPAEILCMLTAAWIQFETHDWFSHGNNQPDRKIDVPIPTDDASAQAHDRSSSVDATLEDTSRAGNAAHPPTFINYETHWWDASQIYGSTSEKIDRVRAHMDGKLNLGEDNSIPIDPETGTDLVGNSGT